MSWFSALGSLIGWLFMAVCLVIGLFVFVALVALLSPLIALLIAGVLIVGYFLWLLGIL